MMYTEAELFEIIAEFDIEGRAETIKALGPGFINDTFIVSTSPDMTSGKAPRYILQRKNHNVFPDIPGMMSNIRMITDHLRRKVTAAGGDPDREVLKVIRRKADSMNEEEKSMTAGDLCYRDSNGNWWAVCLFIEGSVTYEKADSPELAYKGGEGIGRFQSMLADFTTPLNETIKGFHNIRLRLAQWDDALRRDSAGRVREVAEEISRIESRREKMLDFWSLAEKGILPARVTHNDTKISNILFDKSGNVLCVIDLDTCMSSTSLNDFGDAIRSYANTGAEDDRDLDKVSMSMEMFRAYTSGYLSQRKNTLTDEEAAHLAFSALYITYEQVLRFLMDYIDGDTYYKTAYPEHNLVRTRAQNKLLLSMEEQYDEMRAVVDELMK